jgi:hypothetical protein
VAQYLVRHTREQTICLFAKQLKFSPSRNGNGPVEFPKTVKPSWRPTVQIEMSRGDFLAVAVDLLIELSVAISTLLENPTFQPARSSVDPPKYSDDNFFFNLIRIVKNRHLKTSPNGISELFKKWSINSKGSQENLILPLCSITTDRIPAPIVGASTAKERQSRKTFSFQAFHQFKATDDTKIHFVRRNNIFENIRVVRSLRINANLVKTCQPIATEPRHRTT